MRFNKHTELGDKHSFLSPSKYVWLRYDDEKLERVFMEHLAAQRGSEEHAWASESIRLGHRMPEEPLTMNMYINDSIGYRMTPEVALYWSMDCFGKADAIGFSTKQGILRISDLKTGKTPTKFDQLLIYAALFCLEYEITKPWEIQTELRIYQSNRVKLYEPDGETVFQAMDRILTSTRLLETIRAEQFA